MTKPDMSLYFGEKICRLWTECLFGPYLLFRPWSFFSDTSAEGCAAFIQGVDIVLFVDPKIPLRWVKYDFVLLFHFMLNCSGMQCSGFPLISAGTIRRYVSLLPSFQKPCRVGSAIAVVWELSVGCFSFCFVPPVFAGFHPVAFGHGHSNLCDPVGP